MKQEAPPRARPFTVHSSDGKETGLQQGSFADSRATVQASPDPVQLAFFGDERHAMAGEKNVTIELRIDGRTTIIDGKHRLLAFLEVAERTTREDI